MLICLLSLRAQAGSLWTYSEEPVSLSDISLSGMTSQEVRSSGLSSLELSDLVPSLQIQGSKLTGPTPTLFLRGSPSDEVLILWNGIELNDPAAGGGGASPLEIGREFSHQMIVTKGPQTLLDGPQALAGVLNWKKSTAISSRAQVSVGTLQNQSGLFEYQKKNRDSAWGVGGSSFRSQGLSVSADPSTNEKDAQTMSTGSAFFEGRLNDQSGVEAWVMSSLSENDDDLFGAQDPDAKSTHRLSAGRLSFKQDYSEKDLLKFELQNVWSQRVNRNDPISISGGYLDQTTGQRTKQVIEWNRTEPKYFFDFHVDSIQEAMSGTSESSLPKTGFDRRQSNQGIAAILSTANKDAKIGLRSDQFNQDADQRQSVFSWNLFQRGPEFLNSMRPFISISEGHRFPTLYQRYSSYGNSALQSQAMRDYEIGTEGFFQTSSRYLAVLFRNDYTQMIDYDLVTSKYQNRGRTQLWGLEFEISTQTIFDLWTWGFVYLQARDQVLDQKLLRRPNYSSSALWIHQISDFWSSTVGAHWLGARPDQDLSGSVELAQTLQSHLALQYHPISNLKWNLQFENIFNSSSPQVATYTVVPMSASLSVEYAF